MLGSQKSPTESDDPGTADECCVPHVGHHGPNRDVLIKDVFVRHLVKLVFSGCQTHW